MATGQLLSQKQLKNWSNQLRLNQRSARPPQLIPVPDATGGGADGSVDLTLTATANISAFVPVTAAGAAADSGASGDFGKVVGISTAAILNGNSGTVRFSGLLVTNYLFTPNVEVWLSGTVLSNTPPAVGWVQRMGVALSATDLWLEIDQPILL